MTRPDPQTSGTANDPLSVGLDRPEPPAQQPAPSGPGRTRRAGRTIGRSVEVALLLFVTIVLVLFVVFNDQSVRISLVFTDVTTSLVVALIIAAVLGALIGWLTSMVLRTRRRHRS